MRQETVPSKEQFVAGAAAQDMSTTKTEVLLQPWALSFALLCFFGLGLVFKTKPYYSHKVYWRKGNRSLTHVYSVIQFKKGKRADQHPSDA